MPHGIDECLHRANICDVAISTENSVNCLQSMGTKYDWIIKLTGSRRRRLAVK